MKKDCAANDDARSIPLPLAVALLPGDVTATLVAQLCDRTTTEAKRSIDAWVRTGLLSAGQSRGDASRVRPATREAALETTTARQRRRAFGEIARALDEPGAAESELLEIARSYRAAAAYRLSIARYLTVAEAQLDRGERERAAAVVEEAAASIPTRTPEMLAVLDLQAQCAIADARLTYAMTVLERLRRLAAVCGDRYATIRALSRSADCRLLDESYETAIAFAARAVDLCGSMREREHDAAAAHLILAEALVALSRLPEATHHFAAAQALGADRDPATIARFHYVAGLLQVQTDPLAAATAYQAASAAAATELDGAQALRIARALAFAHIQSADLFSAVATLRGAIARAQAQRLPGLVTQLALDLAGAQLEAGRPGEAIRLLTAHTCASNSPIVLRVALACDDRDLVERCAASGMLDDALGSRNPRFIAAVVPSFAEIERRNSAHAAAHALYRRALEVLAGAPAPAEFLCDAAEYCAPSDIAAVRTLLGRAALNATPLSALIIELGCVFLDQRYHNDPAGIAARAQVLQAAFLTRGFKTLATRAGRLALRAAPAGRNESVISLIAAGRSNVEIARELFISKRTVEKTISALLKSHGVRSRWQLAKR